MGKIYTHHGQEQMQVEVILASRGANGAPPIYTLRLRYPRIIHSEIMTHRVFSRNARSSRAVPVKTMLHEVRNMPFIPWHWGKNQKGMQAGAECNELVGIVEWAGMTKRSREETWLRAAYVASEIAEGFMDAGYHKQIPNRLLEPFSWIDTLITATDWANFLWLRDHEDAEPHLQDLARLVKQAIDEADVQVLEEGQWHLPYITAEDRKEANNGPSQRTSWEWLKCISAARCARISYAPFDGDASYERELERYEQLMGSDRLHASPVEHQAQVDTKAWDHALHKEAFRNEDLRGNFATGWIQNRQTIPGQFIPG